MFKTIDLFAGAGGLSLGFMQTDQFNIVAAAEINENTRETYKKNIVKDQKSFEFIYNVIGYDFISLNEKIGGIDVVIGGPPCQGFSNANRQKNHLISMNNSMIKEFFRAIRKINPKAFVMENVSMLRSDTHRFYESEEDEENSELICDIPKRDEKIFIYSLSSTELDLLDISSSLEKVNSLLLPTNLFRVLNMLNKRKGNTERLNVFLKKKRKWIIENIKSFIDTITRPSKCQKVLISKLRTLLLDLQDHSEINAIEELDYILNINKALMTIKEIYHNSLLGYFSVQDNNLVYNVKSYSVIDYITAILGDEYEQKGGILNSVDFGIPQERKRYIIIGIRKDILKDKTLGLPEGDSTMRHFTVGDAIDDLIEYPVGFEKDYKAVPYVTNEHGLSEYAELMRKNSRSVKNHISTKTTEIAMQRFKAISQGNNFHSLPSNLKSDYAKPERTQNSIYLRLDPDKPSGTVVNVRKSMWIHPTLDRAISVREAARLQSFPDEFEFVGTKDSQYQQVGNAVPPLLAYAIANKVLEYLV